MGIFDTNSHMPLMLTERGTTGPALTVTNQFEDRREAPKRAQNVVNSLFGSKFCIWQPKYVSDGKTISDLLWRIFRPAQACCPQPTMSLLWHFCEVIQLFVICHTIPYRSLPEKTHRSKEHWIFRIGTFIQRVNTGIQLCWVLCCHSAGNWECRVITISGVYILDSIQ